MKKVGLSAISFAQQKDIATIPYANPASGEIIRFGDAYSLITFTTDEFSFSTYVPSANSLTSIVVSFEETAKF